MDFGNIFSVVLLILGFGFVIFWHELGHFLAAKWAGVKVEQFAIGFGTAICSWRKGLGFTWGSSNKQVERLKQAESEGVNTTDLSKIGETEYRLNWLPLGGYVKMLGQDDMNPNAQVDDPRAYNMQPIPKRMVIVSAGVIMNIILAMIGFSILFRHGFNVPPAIVGLVVPLSPAQVAGIQVGDKIISMEGKPQLDWTKVPLNVALMPDDRDVTMEVERPSDNNQHHTLTIRASREAVDSHGMLQLGVIQSAELRGLDAKKITKDEQFDPQFDPVTDKQVGPNEEIVAVDGKPVDSKMDYWKLDRAVQASCGEPVPVSVRRVDGRVETEMVKSSLLVPFGQPEVDFAGLMPRTVVTSVRRDCVLKGKILPGDIILSVSVAGDPTPTPTRTKIMELVNGAGEHGNKVEFTVLRDGKAIAPLEAVIPSLKTEQKKLAVGIALECELEHPVIGSVKKDLPVPPGATILELNGQPVKTWHDMHRILKTIAPDTTVKLLAAVPDVAEPKSFDLLVTSADVKNAVAYLYQSNLQLRELIIPRHTKDPLQAAAWGVGETRDLIVQFYLTLKRMAQRSVPASNLMGPVGIARVGADFATRGTDWLIWFLSMISANLAVVNFLPIPIVDGGLFLFLIVEKLQGKPLSARTQSIAQAVGLALILSVFIFVTYQDLTR